MNLLTAHKILISSTIVMFVLFAARELQNYFNGDSSALLLSIVGSLAAVGLALYLRWVWLHPPRGL